MTVGGECSQNVPEFCFRLGVWFSVRSDSLANMISNGSHVLMRISVAQFTGLLQSLGYRARIIRPDLIESASDGMDWRVELWPEGEAETLVFKAEMIVAHDPVADINKFLRFCPNVVPTYEKSEDDASWQITITAVRSVVGGVTLDHISSWIECWVSGLEWATESLFVP